MNCLKYFLSVWIIFVLTSLHAQADERIDHSFSYDIDLRNSAEENAILGTDFDFQYELSRKTVKAEGHQFNLAGRLNGHKDFTNEADQLDQISLSISLRGRYYKSGTNESIPPELLKRFSELGDIPDTLMTDNEEKEYSELFNRAMGNGKPKYFSWDAHLKYESTQDMVTSQGVAGLGISAELPLIHHFLDLVPTATRQGASEVSGFKIQHLRFYFGTDLVFNTEAAKEDDDTNNPSFIRLVAEAAWSTLVFDKHVFKIVWQAQYLPDPPLAFKQVEREFNSFVEASLLVPIEGRTGFLLKYTDGHIPPEYSQTSSGFVGMNYFLD